MRFPWAIWCIVWSLVAGFAIDLVHASDKAITVGYQLAYTPWKVAIASGEFERVTGRPIAWRRFDSGAKVVTAMVSGDVQIALLGSSPLAAAVSRGVDLQLFWIAADIAAAEALVVRNGSGINAPQELKGKRLGVPFVSTSHFHTLFALEQFGIDPKEVTILNMPPDQIVAAWGDNLIDAAFVWYPALGQIKKTGKVLITSGQLSRWGKTTFDAMVASRTFAESHPEFMTKFVKVIAATNAMYRDNSQLWTPTSEMAKAIAKMVGGDPRDVPVALALYAFPSLDEQVSCRWLGCEQDGGAARALRFTGEFLRAQKKITALPGDFSKFVTPVYAEAARKLP